MLSFLQPLSNLHELQLPSRLEHPWTAATLSTVTTCFTCLTSITLLRPAKLTSLAPLSQLKQLQQIKLEGLVAVSELWHVSGLPISSLGLEHGRDEEAELMGWLSTGAAAKLQSLVAYPGTCSEALVTSLAQLPQLRKLSVVVPRLYRDVGLHMQTSNLRPLSSSTSLTALTLGGPWDAPVNMAYLPSKLVELVVVEGGLGNWGPSEDLARRLGRLTSLQLGRVTAADIQKLAMLTRLRSLSMAGWDDRGAFSAASLGHISPLSCLTHLKLVSSWLKHCTPDNLPLLSSLSRLQSLGLWEYPSRVAEMSMSTAVKIITSSAHLATLEVSVSELRRPMERCSYRNHNYSVKPVSMPKDRYPVVEAVIICQLMVDVWSILDLLSPSFAAPACSMKTILARSRLQSPRMRPIWIARNLQPLFIQ